MTSNLQPDFATTPVPASKRRSTSAIAIVLAGFCVCMSGLFTGSAIATGLSLKEAFIATLVGNIILAIYGGLVGAAGAQTGLSTAMLAKRSFGEKGAKGIACLLAVTLLGWYAVQTGFFGQTIFAMIGSSSWIFSVKGAALWGGLLMMITPYIGYRGLQMLSNVSVPLVVLLSFWGMMKALEVTTLGSHVPLSPITLSQGITLAVGSFAVGAVLQADVTRYAKDAKAAWIATFFGYVIANTYIIVAGTLVTMATQTGDLPMAMVHLGLGIPALLILIFAQWTTNDNNLYSSSLSVASVMNVSKKTIVLVCGIIATLVGFLGLAEAFIPWLIVLGIFIPPMAGIMIAEHYVSSSNGTLSGVAFVAWVLGAAAGYIPFGIPSVNAIVVAGCLYGVGVRILRKR